LRSIVFIHVQFSVSKTSFPNTFFVFRISISKATFDVACHATVLFIHFMIHSKMIFFFWEGVWGGAVFLNHVLVLSSTIRRPSWSSI